MLSNQKCTNPTGFHRRQESTPNLLSLHQAYLTRAIRPHSPHHRGLSLDRVTSRLTKIEDGQEGIPRTEDDEGQQDSQQRLQGTQSPGARPGAINIRQENPCQEAVRDSKQPRRYNDAYGCLSAEDIDALLTDLRPTHDPLTAAYNHDAGDIANPFNSRRLEVDMQDVDDADHAESLKTFRPGFRQHAPRSLKMPLTHTSFDFPDSPRTPEHQKALVHDLQAPFTAPHGFAQGTRYNHRTQNMKFSLDNADAALTIKASQQMQRGRSYQDNFASMRHFELGSEPLSPPKTAPLNRRSVDLAVMPSPGFLDMSDLKADMPASRGGYNPANYSPLTNPANSAIASFSSSPEMSKVSLFESAEVDSAVFDAQLSFMQATQGPLDLPNQSSPRQQYQHQQAQSMTDIDLEECTQDTGVTAEEIASFIQGPSPDDQKWSCLFEEVRGKPCGKRFARKENAKSHVQTHLGDRQFVCKVCKTPFVRQHDLKRHFKIHTTEKPHKCPCGKDFHRHDALTRHRQRGMCVGALDGSPKKIVKRGRPKKPRPSNDERTEKAAKTRQLVMERTKPGSTYASSISGSSDYSIPSPQNFDNLSLAASSPSLSHQTFEDFGFPDPPSQPLTPPASPERSPKRPYFGSFEEHSYTLGPTSKNSSPKLASIPEIFHSSAASARQEHDRYQHSPPELDPSSSSPATSNILDFTRFSDGDGSQDDREQRIDCVNPQTLNSDFQLFDNSLKDRGCSVKFEDFLNFGNLDGSSEVPAQKVHSSSNMRHGTFGDTMMSQMDDPFIEL